MWYNLTSVQDADDALFEGPQDTGVTVFRNVKRSVGYLDDESDTESSRTAMKRLRLEDGHERNERMDDEW